MPFILEKKIDLAFISDNWKEAYITFNSPSYQDIREMQELMNGEEDEGKKLDHAITMLEKLFIEGKGYNGTAIAAIDKSDLKTLPLEILTLCMEKLKGQSDPKAQEI